MAEITRPQAPSSANGQTQTYRPDELNPDLAGMAMIRDLMKRWPVPTIVTPRFTVYHGVWSALNHTDANKTFYDCSPRLAVYNGAGNQSVNKDGTLFKSIFALLMKPTYVIQGMPQLTGETTQQPGLISRAFGAITGRGKPQEVKQQ